MPLWWVHDAGPRRGQECRSVSVGERPARAVPSLRTHVFGLYQLWSIDVGSGIMIQFHVLSFEGPDAYACAGGLASRISGLTERLGTRSCLARESRGVSRLDHSV